MATPVVATRPLDAGPRWWERARATIGSDLAVHGLAYLGALFLFVGAFGLVAFAFGGVDRSWRPAAEAAMAAVPFVAAALLLRRGATVAGRALELGGGLLLPVMVITVFLDGVPPDLEGGALVAILTVVLLAISLGYGWWCRHHPDSALRFLVGPVLWLTAGVVTMGVGQTIPSGAAVASLTAAQTTAIAVSLAITLWVARRRTDRALSRATVQAAVPGALILSAMAVLTWLAEDMPAPEILLTGLAGLVVLRLLDGPLPTQVVWLLQPLWWAVVAIALLFSVDPGPAGAVAAAGFIGLLEAQGRRSPSPGPMALSALGAGFAVVLTMVQPWWGLGVAAGTTGWALTRRFRPFALPAADTLLDLATGLLLGLTLLALTAATDNPSLTVLAGACMLLLSAFPARRNAPRRDADDKLWSIGWPAFAALVAWATFAVPLNDGTANAQAWLVAAAAALLAVAAALGPIPPPARPWAVLGLGTWSWLLACSAAELGSEVRGGVLALGGLLVIISANLRIGGLTWRVAGSLGLAGHVLAVVAVPASVSGWPLVLATTAAALGFAATTASDHSDGSPVGAVLAAGDPSLRYLPPILAATGVPLSAALALAQPGVAVPQDRVLPIVLGTTALAYAAASRLRLPHRTRVSLVWVACAAAVLMPLLATERPTAVAGLGVLMLATVVLPSVLRPSAMVWMSWAAAAPLLGLLLVIARPGVEEVTAAAVALVGVGGALVVVGFAVDLRGRRWLPRWRPTRPALVPVVVVGAGEVLAGLLLSVLAVPDPAGAWLTLCVAAVLLAAAALTRVGAGGGAAVALAWLAAGALAPMTVLDQPWVGLATAALLLAGADAAAAWGRTPWWARWDVSLLVAAHLPAATAVIAAMDAAQRPLVLALTGVLAVAVAGRRPALALPYGAAGTTLILLGAADAGSGWTCAALLAATALLALTANRVQQAQLRRWLQVASAMTATLSWQQATVWLNWSAQASVDRTMVAASTVALGWALAAAARPALREWALTAGSAASLVAIVVAGSAVTETAGRPSWAVVAGLGLLALAWIAAGQAEDSTGIRSGAMAMVLAIELVAFGVSSATPDTRVAVLTLTAGAAVLLTLLGWVSEALQSWQRPVLGLAAAAAAVGVLVALVELPDRSLLVPALLVTAIVAAAAGAVLDTVWPHVVAPFLACGAWLVFASEALGGNPQWFTASMGLTLLVVVGVLRRAAKLSGGSPASPGIVTLEMLGVAFLVGSTFVQAVTQSLAYAALAAVMGAAVAGWGILTRVRRRLAAGTSIVLAAVSVLLLVPLVSLLEAWQGTGLWLLILAVGVVFLLVAASIERGRSLVRRVLHGYGELDEDWE